MRNDLRHSVFVLTNLMAAVALAACGGGGSSAGFTEDPAVGAVGAVGAVAADGREEAQAVSAAPTWTYCAKEYQTCRFSGTKKVRYGANGKYFTGTYTGSVRCSNSVFGDPVVGALKQCDISTAAPSPAPSPPPPVPPPPAPAPTPAPTPAPAPPPPSGTVAYGNLSTASLGAGANLNGALAFPSSNAWNADISAAAREPNSDALIASIGLDVGLHPDFGSGTYNGGPIGIPYEVVAGNQPRVTINWTAYGDESDPGPYPVPRSAAIEGGPSSGGDRHVIVIDRDNDRLYELYRAFPNGDGSWNADAGAVFHLDSNNVRPGGQPGWTSGDAAGLPIFPGLARYEEAARGPGGIRHALRFTVARSRQAYVPPASHWASSNTSPNLPPMGMRVRLKASYVIPSNFSTETRALLTAMKTYGMIVADNGSNWFVSGAPDSRWNNDRLRELGQVKGRDFEVVRMDGLVAR